MSYILKTPSVVSTISHPPPATNALSVSTVVNVAFDSHCEGFFIDRMNKNAELFAKYMKDAAFRKLVDERLLTQVYNQSREQLPPPPDDAD